MNKTNPQYGYKIMATSLLFLWVIGVPSILKETFPLIQFDLESFYCFFVICQPFKLHAIFHPVK
jgi:hypothetical protein